MRQLATVHIYDVMDTVHSTATVQQYPDDPQDPPSVVLSLTATIEGTGVTDPRLWLEDALVGLLESI